MKILMVLTSHDELGCTGKKTGFWLEELAAPYYIFLDAGASIMLASPKGGRPPLDPKSDVTSAQTMDTIRFKRDAKAEEALAHTVPLNSNEAQVEAESILRMTARRFAVAHGIAQGNAKLNVGTYVDLQGLGPLFSGKYYLAAVKHTFGGAAGFLTEFTGERAGIGKV